MHSEVLARSRVYLALPLPANFRREEFLAFHQRDPQQLAERVTTDSLQKALLWAGHPALLHLDFSADLVQVELCVDGDPAAHPDALLRRMVRRMLGLDQPVEAFEAACRNHPQIGPLLACRPGMRVPATATPFEALSWAILGQQISVGAAVSVRRRLITAADCLHSSGMACFPDAATVTRLGEARLREAGLSSAKASCLMAVSRRIVDGELPLEDWLDEPDAGMVRDCLLSIKGIGPWTVNYALLRGFGWVDGSLHGDVAVRRALQRLLDLPEKPGEEATRQWLAGFSPWRALVAAHLWASGGLRA